MPTATFERRSKDVIDRLRFASDAGAGETEPSGDLSLFPRPVRRQEIIYLTNQLAIMVDTGVTLSAALGSILEQEQNPTLRGVLGQLRSAVEGGDDFSTALARYPKYFDHTYVSLIRVSEATGSLAEMLDRIATYLRKQLETRNKVRAAMAYPAVMAVMAIGVTIFLLTWVMPKFTPIFDSRGLKLPKPTQFLLTASNLLIGYWYFWVAGAVALI